jgi:dipeptidyl aminopeptidase/acylaminoacyl peptidase
VVDLAAGTELTLGNVAEFAWSRVGSLLAVSIATGTDQGNGVQLYDPTSGQVRSLDASGSQYRQLGWREKGLDLAVLRSVEPASKKGRRYALIAWRGLNGPTPTRLELDPAAAGVADTLELVEHRKPEWSDDGLALSFGLRPVEPKADSIRAADSARTDLPGIQIWHTSDVRLYPQQKLEAGPVSRRTVLAVWHPDTKRVVLVGSDLMEEASIAKGWRMGIERVRAPYGWGRMFGRPYHDLWSVDLTSGARTRVLERVRNSWVSPAGKYALWFDGKDYWSQDLKSGARVNLTASLPTVFADTGYDTPTDQLPPYGQPVWIEDDAAVLLADRYDVWRVGPTGAKPERLTSGAADRVVYRPVLTDREATTLKAAAPIYFSLHGEWSERRGYARLRAGRPLERLVWEEKFVTGLARADSSDTFVYRMEARDDSPDFFVAGPELAAVKPATATNPFMGDYAWGKTRFIEFKSETGRELQAALLYPANHDPSRKYPMVTYVYEILTSNAHQFEAPSERDYYNFTTWTQQGYFVLLPDIVFRARDPGVSIVETVTPAVAAVAAEGLIDPRRVGFIGHSWGGYAATFVPTRTDVFAASVAGAPLTDFVSFMGQLHWNQGTAEVDHWETGQARMEVPYWEDPEAHHRNSPIHKVQDMKTPLLMAFGDNDGTVDWDQGTEFYNFARRAGKQMVLLVYEGENHGFSKKANQIDYHRRILEWFGHYLKDESAPAWITGGVAYERQAAERRRVADGRRSSIP